MPCAVALASGTAAVHLALRAIGVGPGDEVATSTLTFVASANAIRYALEFFKNYEIPLWEMKCEDEMTASQDDYVLAKKGEYDGRHGLKIHKAACLGGSAWQNRYKRARRSALPNGIYIQL